MRVKIGPYRDDLIPVGRWERQYENWRFPVGNIFLAPHYKWYDRVAFKTFDILSKISQPLNRWWCNRPRKVKVHVDYYDIWGVDHTLALIISPTLKKLKQCQHGYPQVDNEDVPENLRISEDMKVHLEPEVADDMHEVRWAYVLDEMIWSFEQYTTADNSAQFYHNVEQLEMLSVPLEDKPGYSTINFNYQKDPSKPAYWVDEEGKKAHYERKKNGLRLFAKYYESLWD